MHYQFIKYSDSIWNESNDDWDEKYISWKAIGTVKNKYPREVSFETKLRSLLEEFLSENIFKKATLYHVIEYQSGRLDLGYDYCEYKLNSYVVVEADRGEDCGKVIGVASEVSYKEFITKQRYLGNEVELKKIIRQASDNDIEELKMRKEDENACLKQCKELVESKNINMEILSCEYQWDMKKITFYFKSGKRIDFRDLLKELFKIFKIRIWLCAEKRSMNCFIREILE